MSKTEIEKAADQLLEQDLPTPDEGDWGRSPEEEKVKFDLLPDVDYGTFIEPSPDLSLALDYDEQGLVTAIEGRYPEELRDPRLRRLVTALQPLVTEIIQILANVEDYAEWIAGREDDE